jgi:nucleotide-binding universal stress UspA family protein
MKILIATDGSKYGDAAVRAAACRPWPKKSELRVMMVTERPTISYVSGDYGLELAYNHLAGEMRESLNFAARHIAESLKAEGRLASYVVREGVVTEQIINEAREWGADLILVGTHSRRGISRFLFGSVSQLVAVHAPCSVEIIREQGG